MDEKITILPTLHRTGGKLYRIFIHRYDEQKNHIGVYEIWATLEAVKSRTHGLLNDNPLPSQLNKFAKDFYEHRLDEKNYDLSTETGAFITDTGVTYGNADTFSEKMTQIAQNDSYIQTNISLPSSLHEWLKMEAVQGKKSLSEIIRLALLQYKKDTFICTNCKKLIQGNPFFETDKERRCYDCFLKPFEET